MSREIVYSDINRKRLMKVKTFNRVQEQRYNEHMEQWKSENRYGLSGMPHLNMYIFVKDNGVPYKKGYVVTKGNSHKFYHTKEEVFTIENMRTDLL